MTPSPGSTSPFEALARDRDTATAPPWCTPPAARRSYPPDYSAAIRSPIPATPKPRRETPSPPRTIARSSTPSSPRSYPVGVALRNPTGFEPPPRARRSPNPLRRARPPSPSPEVLRWIDASSSPSAGNSRARGTLRGKSPAICESCRARAPVDASARKVSRPSRSWSGNRQTHPRRRRRSRASPPSPRAPRPRRAAPRWWVRWPRAASRPSQVPIPRPTTRPIPPGRRLSATPAHASTRPPRCSTAPASSRSPPPRVVRVCSAPREAGAAPTRRCFPARNFARNPNPCRPPRTPPNRHPATASTPLANPPISAPQTAANDPTFAACSRGIRWDSSPPPQDPSAPPSSSLGWRFGSSIATREASRVRVEAHPPVAVSSTRPPPRDSVR